VVMLMRNGSGEPVGFVKILRAASAPDGPRH
jgi:hypothetical protein